MPYLSRLLELGTRFYRRNHFVECFLFLFSIFVMYLLIPEENLTGSSKVTVWHLVEDLMVRPQIGTHYHNICEIHRFCKMLELFCLEIFEVALWRIILSRSENAISGVFSVVMEPRVRPTPHFRYNYVFFLFNYIYFENFRIGGGYPLQRCARTQKTPEMNELECGSNSLKTWAPNFEKQKSYSVLGSQVFFAKKTCDVPREWICPLKLV